MVVRQVKPINSGDARPPRGRLTWMALFGMALFAAVLLFVVVRPVVDRNDGPERGPPQVNAPATGTAEAVPAQQPGDS